MSATSDSGTPTFDAATESPAPAGARAGAPPSHFATSGAPAPAPRRPRRWWPWVLLMLAMLIVAGVVGSVCALGETLDQALGGFDIRVDGERVLSLPRGEAVWWALAAALLAAMVVMVVVPLALLLALLVTALALGAAVVVVLAVAAVVLSPLWALALALWLALREPRVALGSRAGAT